MSSIKLIVLALQLLKIFAARTQRQDLEPYSRFRSIQCSSSNISLTVLTCFVKAYSRKVTTITVNVNITRPLYSANLHYEFRSKSISNSQRSIINVTFNICSILNGTGSNPVFQWLIGHVPQLKESLHPCPYLVVKLIRFLSNLFIFFSFFSGNSKVRKFNSRSKNDFIGISSRNLCRIVFIF